MKPILPLTELKIRNLQAKPDTAKYFDGEGLYLEVLPSGTKTWRLKHKVDGRDKRTTIGRYPEIGLKTAREMAAKLKASPPAGRSSPSLDEPMTVDQLCGSWRESHLRSITPKEAKRKIFFIDRYISPAIGSLPVGELTPPIVLRQVLRPIVALDFVETARRVKSVLSQILRYGVAMGQNERDCTMDLKGALPPRVVTHQPTLIEPSKIGRLLLDIRHYTGSPSVTYALRILPYVFVRPGELRHAEWSEIDLEGGMWRIPAEKMKMRSPHLVPLSTQVVEMMSDLRGHTGSGRFLFPGRRVDSKPISDVTINAALRYLGYDRKQICGHGFRAMASTLLNEKGYPSDWIERQLAHVERNGVRAAYNHADWLPERRRMMQDWADYLDKLILDASL